MNKSILLAAAVVCAFFPVTSVAGTVTVAISGSYSDSTTFSGSIVYDQTTQQVTSATIIDSAGYSPASAQTYVGTGAFTSIPTSIFGCTTDCGFFGFEFYTAGNPAGLPYLDLLFSGDPATFSGGPILAVATFNGGADTRPSQEVFDEFLIRGVAGGTASVGAPEPGSVLLLLSGVAALALRRRAFLPRR